MAILDGSYVLTTRHCVTVHGKIIGEPVDPSLLVFETAGETFFGVELFTDFDADLALIRLDRATTEAFAIWDVSFGQEVGPVFRVLGYGDTNANGDSSWGPAGRGTQRTFSNVFDEVRIGGLQGQGEVLRYDYDLTGDTPAGDLEGLHGPGDSGAPALLEFAGQLYVAGIASSGGDPVDGASGSFVRFANHREVILEIVTSVPEPSTVSLLLLLIIRELSQPRWRPRAYLKTVQSAPQ